MSRKPHPKPLSLAIKGMLLCLGAMASMQTYAQNAQDNQAYPQKAVTLVVPFPAGGSNDQLARLLGTRLNAKLGQSFIVENKPGATGNIGTAHVARAPKDGYTLLVVANGLAINQSLYGNLSFDGLKDLAPVALLASSPMLIAAKGDLLANNAAEAIALSKKTPAGLTYGSCGSGSAQHIAMEMLKLQTGANLIHVPYKGCANTTTDLLGGQLDLGISTLSNLMQHIKAGKVKPIAVTTLKRSPLAPDIPSLAEAGIKDFAVDSWFGLLAPAGTPQSVINVLNKNINDILTEPETREKLSGMYFDPLGGTPERFQTVLRDDFTRFGSVIERQKIKVD